MVYTEMGSSRTEIPADTEHKIIEKPSCVFVNMLVLLNNLDIRGLKQGEGVKATGKNKYTYE